ncbi:unnamed protein product [Acanthoscelides obtectus]|uniref:Uncharacterized protein n=1 Tax=Acanthoscelides obtectus TaxID=200917 RepID=A0A9P0K8R9_ACAOB|nr:unnamed protein product [Acanthoscelides obtectus]CAK1633556.1 hypothetical protein AOBTE_LOCUS8220 [Acanthoscelides obtectus]
MMKLKLIQFDICLNITLTKCLISPNQQYSFHSTYLFVVYRLFMDEEMYNFPGSSNEEQYVHTSSTLSASESDSAAKTAGVQEHMLVKKKRKRLLYPAHSIEFT